ncbi:conserved hypothetical protein, partial [Burkholderia pseudomallei S13]
MLPRCARAGAAVLRTPVSARMRHCCARVPDRSRSGAGRPIVRLPDLDFPRSRCAVHRTRRVVLRGAADEGRAPR